MKSKTRILWLFLFLFGGLLLAACGKTPEKAGGACKHNIDCEGDLVCLAGKCTNAIAEPEVKTPLARITGPLKVKVGMKVLLDGTRSIGYSPNPLSFNWSLTPPKNSKASLNDTKTNQVAFTPDLAGIYVVTLTVKDGKKESEKAQVKVEAFKENVPPEAKVTPISKLVKVGDKVELDGSASTDADKDQLTFKWDFHLRPKDSQATLANADTEKASFTPDKAGDYVVNLIVDDGNGGKATAQSFITAVAEPPAPKLTKLTPEKSSVGATADIEIEGEHFVYGVKVALDGKAPVKLRYVDPKKLIATYDFVGWKTGKYELSATNPDGKESNKLSLELSEAPAPTISYVGPSLVIAGQRVLLHVDGSNFVKGATVYFDGKALQTTFVSDKVLRAVLIVPKDGTYKVYVENPNKKKSNEYDFVVSSVKPIIDSISFSRIGNDCKSETIVVKGRNLLPGISAFLVASDKKKYAPVKVNYRSMTSVELEFDFTKLPKGNYSLELTNVGAAIKATHPFEVVDPIPAPQVAAFAPKQLFVGGKTELYLAGVYFEGAKFKLDGKDVVPAPLNRSTRIISLDLTKSSPGKVQLEIIGLCAKKADPIVIKTLAMPKPSITKISPNKIDYSSKEPVELRGKNFHSSAKIYVDGKVESAAVVQHSGLIYLPLSIFTSAGNKKISVENPDGQKSSEVTLTVDHTPYITKITPKIIYRGYTGSVTVEGKNFAKQATVLLDGQAVKATRKNSTTFSLAISLFSQLKTYKIVVENPGNVKSKEATIKKDYTPVIDYLDPAAAVEGSTPSKIEIKGFNFDNKTSVIVDGKKITGATFSSPTSMNFSYPSTWKTKGTYKLKVEDSTGKQSNEVKFVVYPAGSMVLTSAERASTLYYLTGINIRTSGYSGDSTIVVRKNGKEVFRKKASNSYMKNKIYISFSDLSGLTNDPYEIMVCRPIGPNKSEVCSNALTVSFHNSGSGSGSSGSNKSVSTLPVIAAIAPEGDTKSFVISDKTPPATISFSILGFSFQSKSKVFINGQDATTFKGVTISVAHGSNNDIIKVSKVPLSELKVGGDSSIEVTNEKGRSNTFYLHIDNKDFIRILTNAHTVISIDAAFKFIFYGENFVGNLSLISNGNPIKENKKPLPVKGQDFSLTSNTWKDATKLNPGSIPIIVENSKGTKSNKIMMKAISPGSWGQEPLGLKTIGSVSEDKEAPSLAPYPGETVEWRIGVTGFVTAAGIGGTGVVLVDNKEIKKYVKGAADADHINAGYTYVRLPKQTIMGKPRLIPIQLKNPGNKLSNTMFATVLPKDSMRLTRIGDEKYYMGWWSEYYPAFCYVNILRPNQKQALVVLGSKLRKAKFYLGGMELKVESTTDTKATLVADIPDLPDGIYPLWAKKGSTVSNTIFVNVYKDDGIGGVPRIIQMAPLVVEKAAFSKTNNKVRFYLYGNGMTKDLKAFFDGKPAKLIYVDMGIVFVEVDMTNVSTGYHKIELAGPNGKIKTFDYQIEVQ